MAKRKSRRVSVKIDKEDNEVLIKIAKSKKVRTPSLSIPVQLYEKIMLPYPVYEKQSKNQRYLDLLEGGIRYERMTPDVAEQTFQLPYEVENEQLKKMIELINFIKLTSIVERLCEEESYEHKQTYTQPVLINQDEGPKEQEHSAFEQLWKRYPKKAGKPSAEKLWKNDIKNDHQKIIKIWNSFYYYLEYVKKDRQKGQYRPFRDGSTWFNNWMDFLPYEESKMDYSLESIMNKVDRELEAVAGEEKIKKTITHKIF